MRVLENYCIDISDAKMCWVLMDNHHYCLSPKTKSIEIQSTEIIPAYTIYDLIKKLPDCYYKYNNKYKLIIMTIKEKEHILFKILYKDLIHNHVDIEIIDTPLTALYNTLIKVYKENLNN